MRQLPSRASSQRVRTQVLNDAPDPATALQELVDDVERLIAGVGDAGKMMRELEEYRSEISLLKNQEVTIKTLERRLLAVEADAEDKVSTHKM